MAVCPGPHLSDSAESLFYKHVKLTASGPHASPTDHEFDMLVLQGLRPGKGVCLQFGKIGV